MYKHWFELFGKTRHRLILKHTINEIQLRESLGRNYKCRGGVCTQISFKYHEVITLKRNLN